MVRHANYWVITALALSALSCTATRTSAPTSAAGVTRIEIRTGDVIRVLDKYRQQYTLKITALIEVNRHSALRTAGAAPRRKRSTARD